ncbi:MAG: uracil-DNA glycosylase [Betaproteobacteria bacterium]|nr:uracil-DNA glycosylase [Betaproteobacteria bacterium]
MNPRRSAILREMGLAPLWRLRTSAGTADAGEVLPSPAPAEHPLPQAGEGNECSGLNRERLDVSRIAAMDWQELEETIHACRACVLCEKRTQAVPGVGDRQAHWMFVGEGPGVEEDRQGQPFVGQAGKLLDRMLSALDLERGKDVYIANAVKCRPPHNRTPEVAEIAACAAYLDRQIALVQPRLLIALGRPAAQALLGREISIAAARGKRFERGGVPVIVTYHPAYLLRNPLDKGKAWEDLCLARRIVTEGAM